jgi:hypothetical protein
VPAGASDEKFLAGVSPATCDDERGRRTARAEMDLFSTVSMTLRCRGKILVRMRTASVYLKNPKFGNAREKLM